MNINIAWRRLSNNNLYSITSRVSCLICFSGIECENEVYSARQLEARSVDAAASCDKPKSSSVDQVEILATVSLINNKIVESKDRENIIEDIDIKNSKIINERSRPLAVTASLFRTQEPKPQKEVLASKKDSDQQKNILQKPVSSTDQIFGELKKIQLPPEQHLFQVLPEVYLYCLDRIYERHEKKNVPFFFLLLVIRENLYSNTYHRASNKCSSVAQDLRLLPEVCLLRLPRYKRPEGLRLKLQLQAYSHLVRRR